ncbi:DUF1146 family protein [Bacillus tianshenii]|nr:DUF1146 family protein [Bacillus tianshenii]
MGADFAQQAMLGMVVHLLFFVITWWALQGIRIDVLIKSGKTGHAKALLILLTIAIGSTVGNFFLDYLFWAKQMKYLF